MSLSPDMTISQRVWIIEDALAKLLDRDDSMFIDANNGDRFIAVIDPDCPDSHCLHSLYWIAVELEGMLS